MDRHRVDQLAVLLAATRSRRQVVQVVTAGFVSTVILARSARPAAAELCQERVPKPGYTPEVNGCGPSGYGWTVPDSYGDANWTPACNRHDKCYGTCNESRLKCDVLMRKSMQHACKRAYRRDDERKKMRKCLGRARFYFNVVSNSGQSAYEAAQDEACDCCGAGGDSCGTRCCVQGSVCVDRATSRCCAEAEACGSTCCATSSCFKCSGGTCQYQCPSSHYCAGGECKDCGPWGCGG